MYISKSICAHKNKTVVSSHLKWMNAVVAAATAIFLALSMNCPIDEKYAVVIRLIHADRNREIDRELERSSEKEGKTESSLFKIP